MDKKKLSNIIRLIISLAVTLGVFFILYIVFYWNYLNTKFKSTSEYQYTEVATNASIGIHSKLNTLQHDVYYLLDNLNETNIESHEFVSQFRRRIQKVLLSEGSYAGLFLLLEPKVSLIINSNTYTDDYKRFSFYADKNKFGGIAYTNFQNNLSKDINAIYDDNFQFPEKRIIYPYKKKGKNLIIFLYPVRRNKSVIGLMGFMLHIDYFNLVLKEIYDKNNRQISISLITNKGNIIAYAPLLNTNYLGLRLEQISRSKNITALKNDTIIEQKDQIAIGEKVSTNILNFPWYINLEFDKASYRNFTKKIIFLNTSLALAAFLALFIVMNFLFKTYNLEIKRLLKFAQRISLGVIKTNNFKYKNEEFQQLNEKLNEITKFEDNLGVFFDKIHARDYASRMEERGKKDILTKKLNSLVERLAYTRSQAEKQAKEVEFRNWGRKALAEFTTILAATNRSLEEVSGATLSKFSELFGLVIGAIYVLRDNDDQKYLDLVKAYALDHEKQKIKHIELGEGFVGAVALEQKPIFIDKVPENYLEITTGLGRTKPTFLIFVPLIFEQETIGVLELATLRDINEFEQQFIVSVADSIAISLSGIIINNKTKILLEQSNKQAEILQTREEELQQNISELKELQEQTSRMSLRLDSLTRSIDFFFYAFELDLKGRILQVNSYFKENFKFEDEAIIGKSYELITNISENTDFYASLWEDLKRGINRRENELIVINKHKRNLINFYTPIKRDSESDITSIYVFGIDITAHVETKTQLTILKLEKEKKEHKLVVELKEQKSLNERFRIAHKDLLNIIEAIDKRIIRIEYDIEGNIVKANSLYYKFVGIDADTQRESIIQKTKQDKGLKERWAKVLDGQINEVLTKVKSRSGKEYWWNIIDIPVSNRAGNIIKVISIAIDLTKEKSAEIKTRQEYTNQGILLKKHLKKINELETRTNILNEENKVKEEMILKLKDDIKKLKAK